MASTATGMAPTGATATSMREARTRRRGGTSPRAFKPCRHKTLGVTAPTACSTRARKYGCVRVSGCLCPWAWAWACACACCLQGHENYRVGAPR